MQADGKANRVVFFGKVVRAWRAQGRLFVRLTQRIHLSNGHREDVYVNVLMPESVQVLPDALVGQHLYVEGRLTSRDYFRSLVQEVRKAGGDYRALEEFAPHLLQLRLPRSVTFIHAFRVEFRD